MDWYPLLNSLRIAAVSTMAVFFLGILAAYYIAKLPRLLKGVLDVVLTLPLVLPPTVVGWLLLVLLGPKRAVGAWAMDHFGVKLVMTWWSAIFATVVVSFPLMYRTARVPSRASIKLWRTLDAPWDAPMPGSSGGSKCRCASREFSQAWSSPLPGRWGNMVPLP